jgi:hypothetical protein
MKHNESGENYTPTESHRIEDLLHDMAVMVSFANDTVQRAYYERQNLVMEIVRSLETRARAKTEMTCAKCRRCGRIIRFDQKSITLGWTLDGVTWHEHNHSKWHLLCVPKSLLKRLGLKRPKVRKK